MLLIKNDAYSTLAVDLLATDTSISLVAGTGDRFPVVAEPDYAYATLQNAQGRKERIKIVARASGEDVMTIVRAQDDSAARFWAAGDLIECRASAAVLGPLQVLEGEKTADGILGKLGFTELGAAWAKLGSAVAARQALGGTAVGQQLFTAQDLPTVRGLLDFMNLVYPVGSLYCNATNSANPADVLGFGTWAAFGQGRVLIGVDTGNALFSGSGRTGGSADAVLVGHNHTTTVTDPGHSHSADQPYPGSTAANGGGYFGQGNNRATGSATTGISVSVGSAGVSGTNANYQPYVTVFMWVRTA